MSSELAPSTAPTTAASTGYRRAAALVIGVLLAMVVGMTAAGAVRGPHVVRADLNPAATVEHPGQRLTLRLDQAVTAVTAAQVHVDPAARIEVTNQPTAVVVTFTTALHYATTYRVTATVQGADTGRRSTLSYAFRTPDPTLYTLQRATPAGLDRIVRSVVGPPGTTVVRSQADIQEFAVAEPEIAVVTTDADGLGTVQVGATDSSARTRTVTAGERISDLKSSGTNGIFGYVVTSDPSTDDPTAVNLVQLQLFAPGSDTQPVDVVGLDGKPVQVRDWSFVPGTTLVVVQATNSAMYLVDPSRGGRVTPLGGHLTLHGLGRGTTLLVEDEDDTFTTIDLVTGATSRLPPFGSGDGELPHVQPLPEGAGYAGVLVTVAGHSTLRYSVVVLHGRAVRELYRPPADTPIADTLCLSSNGEYLLVQARPDDTAQFDDTGVTSTVVDVATGRTLLEVPGSAGSWCH